MHMLYYVHKVKFYQNLILLRVLVRGQVSKYISYMQNIISNYTNQLKQKQLFTNQYP